MVESSSAWKNLYKWGGAAALGAVAVGIIEILITFLPGGNTTQETARDWFLLFQQNGFMGLRNLGLLNIFLNLLAILTYFNLYAVHRATPQQPYAALAVIFAFLGIGVFFATNRAFSMLALSAQYTAATSDAQRLALESAGQALLSVGQSHTPGTFAAFFLIEFAGVMISWVMLRSKIFSRTAALAGMLGYGMLLVFEFVATFATGLSTMVMLLAILGGIASMLWSILIARRFFQLAKEK